MKVTQVMKFRPGTGFDDGTWHVATNPAGEDRTLCGIAWEGDGGSIGHRYPNPATEGRQGVPTCPNCIRYIKFCASIA
jgi:hypothetical protein